VLTSLTGFQKLSPEQMRMISDPSAHACYRS
jgi:hypothetical protein